MMSDQPTQQSNTERLIALEQACRKNARALEFEARALLSQSIPRSFFLALTGHEELAKAQLVADFRAGLMTEPAFRAAFRDHPSKFAYLQREITSDPASAQHAKVTFTRGEGKVGKEFREAVLYVDMADDFTAVEPGLHVTRELTEKTIQALNGELCGMNAHDLIGGIDSASLLKTRKSTENA